MTKPKETKEKFIELRASGMTLVKAADQLDISYNTAVNWVKELKEYIDASKAIKMEELIEKYRMTKERRIELYGERLLAIQDELAKRDLSEVPTPKLFDMMIKCYNALQVEAEIPEFLTDDDIKELKEERTIEKQEDDNWRKRRISRSLR